jgi:predicted Zn-dependent protease with MMP-like domain
MAEEEAAFEQSVEEALDSLPPELADLMSNVAVVVGGLAHHFGISGERLVELDRY